MKIIVTGALGHIGSLLIRKLPLHFPNAQILMFDNLMTQRYCSLFDLPKSGNFKFEEIDIANSDLDHFFIGSHVVIHLAAITDAAGSFDKADQLERNNFISTSKVAEACLRNGVRLITLSSTSVYGTQESEVSEDCLPEDLKPQSPYATTKLKEEVFVRHLCKNNGLKVVTFRFGTIVGVSPGIRFHTAVNKFCWQAANKLPITVWNTAYDQVRPYLVLNDAIQTIVEFIRNDIFDGEIYNVVSKNCSVREIVEIIQKYIPSLNINFVDSPIMNQLSYHVRNDKINSKIKLQWTDDLESAIKEELELLNAL